MANNFDGSRIKQLRKQKGFSQKALAQGIGISNTYLSDIEIGRTDPSLKVLIKIAEVLGVEINTFIEATNKDRLK